MRFGAYERATYVLLLSQQVCVGYPMRELPKQAVNDQ
jgi:hypothetical protein